MRIVLLAWLTALLLICCARAQANDSGSGYQLGRGYKLGDSGINLGGYANVLMHGLGPSPTAFAVDDLSLFASWDNGSKLRYFSETEVEDDLTYREGRALTTSRAKFRLERIYLDYLLSDNITLRIGKILTPIGQWNLIHANPLVWTTTRPVATSNLFAEHATGIMLQGLIPLGDRFIEYSAYGDYTSSLDPVRGDNPNFDNAQGLRLRYSLYDNLQIGFSYADYALMGKTDNRNHLSGLDLAWSYQRFAVNSEIVYRDTNDRNTLQHGWQGYIQGVSPLSASLYAVGRYEFFDQAKLQPGEAEVLGLAYRPTPPLAVKVEYRLGRHNRQLAPDGLFASFSLLF